MKRTYAAAAVGLLLVAACGGGDGDGDGGTVATTPWLVADSAGCKYQPYKLYPATYEILAPSRKAVRKVKDHGKCTIDGQGVTIYTYKDTDGRDFWLEKATTFGGVFLVGDNWIITGPRAALEAAQENAGGEIQ